MPQKEPRRSPYAHLAEQQEASGRKYREIAEEIGRAFAPLQAEAYASYVQWDEEQQREHDAGSHQEEWVSEDDLDTE